VYSVSGGSWKTLSPIFSPQQQGQTKPVLEEDRIVLVKAACGKRVRVRVEVGHVGGRRGVTALGAVVRRQAIVLRARRKKAGLLGTVQVGPHASLQLAEVFPALVLLLRLPRHRDLVKRPGTRHVAESEFIQWPDHALLELV
jgi:hypothetical protein